MGLGLFGVGLSFLIFLIIINVHISITKQTRIRIRIRINDENKCIKISKNNHILSIYKSHLIHDSSFNYMAGGFPLYF